MNIALIIAGGSGNRMGQDIPKQFMYVDNAPIIIHTLQCFQLHPDIAHIAVVCLAGWETVLQSYSNQYNITKLKHILPGGNSGMESIHNGIYGLKELKTGMIGCLLIGLLLLGSIPVTISSVRTIFDSAVISTAVERKQRADTLGEYVLDHPENIYIEDTKAVRDLFPSSPRPMNVIVWGKPDFNSAAQKARLGANGIERLTGEVMKRQNVYFISEINLADLVGKGKRVSSSGRLLHFYRWLQQEYGAVGIRQEEQIMTNLVVYQFVFGQNGPESEYYDIQSDGQIIVGST